MKRARFVFIGTLLAISTTVTLRGLGVTPATSPRTPVVDWSLEAQRAIVPPPAGVGNKFPGEGAVYMGIVHVAMYDAAVAIQGGYRPYARPLTARTDTSPAAAAAYGALIALLPRQRGDLDKRYAGYLSRLPADAATANGIALGEHVAAAIVALRADDGRDTEPKYVQPPPGPGVFEPDPTRPLLGLRLSRIRPLALDSPGSFGLKARLR